MSKQKRIEKFNKKAIKATGKQSIITNITNKDSSTELPTAIVAKNNNYILLGVALLVVALIGSISSKSLAFLGTGLIASFAVFILYYLRKRDVEKNGYEEMHFITRNYTFLPGPQKKPSGILLSCTDPDRSDKQYHIAVSGDKIPLDWNITLYTPKNVAITKINEILYISTYYGYELKGECK